MKKCLFILVILILLIAGCTNQSAIHPSPTSTAPSGEQESDSGPSSPSETLQLSWTVDPGVRLEYGSVPNIIRLEDGRIRMYYGGMNGIQSAVSDDGLVFTKESGVRISPGSQDSPEMIVSDPTLVMLEDGRVRMYYKGALGQGGPGQSVHTVFSAISSDGLLFEKEGIRIDSQNTPDRGWASVPDAIVLPDGRVRLYYVSDGLDVKHGVVSAISEDGLSFTREGPVLTGFVDPSVIRLADGTYIMLAVAFPFHESGKLTDADWGIYSFTSEDGTNFTDRKLVLAGEGNIDPAIIDMGDGTYRVYYWNINDQPSKIKSLTGKKTSTASPAPASPETNPAVPEIVPVLSAGSIAGASVWLFAVDDGSPQLAVSAELDGKLIMGRLNVTDPDASVSWQTVADTAGTDGVSIADHWHIFAHGYHWLVFSVAGDSASYLLKLDRDFQRLAIVPVGHEDGPTNDMFLVAEPDGIAVAHFVPGYGHVVHRFDINADKTGQVRIGGGEFSHSNGSSAIPADGGYLVFASETLNPLTTGAVLFIRFDDEWRPLDIRPLFDEDGTNAAMATAVLLDSGYTIISLRIITGVSSRQTASPVPQPGSPLPHDGGALLRLVMAPDGTIVSREILVSEEANRPHTILVGDLLVTTWDEIGSVHLRVDSIR